MEARLAWVVARGLCLLVVSMATIGVGRNHSAKGGKARTAQVWGTVTTILTA